MRILALSIVLLAGAVPATAQDDFYRSVALTTGDGQSAIGVLEQRAKADSWDECALINLAVAYGRQGRSADAQSLYRRVLALENVEVGVAGGGAMWSHDIARAALKPVAFSAR